MPVYGSNFDMIGVLEGCSDTKYLAKLERSLLALYLTVDVLLGDI
jgi:hypothetical protein